MSLDSNISALATAIGAEVKSKQNELVSGTNIKTINGNSILGAGDLIISGGSGTVAEGVCFDPINKEYNFVVPDGVTLYYDIYKLKSRTEASSCIQIDDSSVRIIGSIGYSGSSIQVDSLGALVNNKYYLPAIAPESDSKVLGVINSGVAPSTLGWVDIPLTWTDYVTRAEYVSSSNGVITYIFNGNTIYRNVPSPYVMVDDAFYSDSGLTQLLSRRA